MKRYRCKIDSPWGKKGEILDKEIIVGYRANDGSIAYSKFTPDVMSEIFEEIPDRWVPEESNRYWTVLFNNKLIVEELYFNSNLERDQIRLKQNLVFRTKEKAQAVLDKILKLLEEEKEV